MKDLDLCNFIEAVLPYDREEGSKLVRYQVADPYLHFYFRFIQPKRQAIANGSFEQSPEKALPLQEYHQWLGYAFERWCRREHVRIAQILGFSGVQYRSGAYFARGADPGFQFDLVFERADRVITVCEIKFTTQPIGSSAVQGFERALSRLKLTPTQSVHRVLINAAGIDAHLAANPIFDRVITLSELLTS
ncbi:MAG: hypothetical protein HY717_17035 [Planctomycetes bacterium]|nr:hypothetical protein [Planctomycetota bacterium]